MSLFTCRHCSRGLSNVGALGKHEKHCKSNPNYVKAIRSPRAGAPKGSIPWNKGQKSKISAWNKGLKGTTTGVGRTVEKETERRQKISEKARLSNGGYRKGSGRGKKGYYKGIWCDSSWELAFVIYNLDHGISFSRNTLGFTYDYNGSSHKYYPDFKVGVTHFKVKGFLTQQYAEKLRQFNEKLHVLDKKGIKPYLDYVISRYGKNYIDLYKIGE